MTRSPKPPRCCGRSKATVFCWAMGLTQHHNSVAVIKEVCNVAFAQGNIGRRGAGLLPVRGHSNVQGDRTMGIWERPPVQFLDALQAEFGFDPPREHGYDTVDAIRALRDGKAGVFIGLGGNFVQAAPDTDVTAAALRKASLTVHVSTKLNRSHLVCGQHGADPADAGPHRDRRAGQRTAVRHRRGLDVQCARLPRTAGARPVRSCARRYRS